MRIPVADRALAVLGYLPFLPFFVLPVVFRRESMFAQFHGRQAGVLWGMWFVPILLILLVMVGADWFASGIPVGVQTLLVWVMVGLTFVYLVFVVVGMLKSLIRERYRMPLVADVALLLRL